MNHDADREDRLAGGLIGGVVGDVLGVPVDFFSREDLTDSPQVPGKATHRWSSI